MFGLLSARLPMWILRWFT